jgi:lipopolysaccharide export system protein LptC
VRWLRIGVPAAIAVALLLVIGANYMPAVGPLRLPGELGNLVIKGTKVTMQAPRMSGYTADARPYEFIANSADQDITQPDLMELHQIKAKVEMEDKSMVNLTSRSGVYNMKTEMLTLSDHVDVVSSTGYEMRLNEAKIDVHKGTVQSDKPVWVKLTNGTLNARRMEVRDGGAVIRFTGGVSMLLHPDQIDTQASDK